ncbi:TIGR02922 family protein [Colwellia sp. RSH04]|uniref:TIGR02922 family protein n=1 Tax=Colwellia sp. RSH04 TaxID=2305464 RepID=UPI000E584ABB|nr:TIGR02922 family protein [Colwellia sp. RSH04]RHW77285.1 TIGR02922 family protein [Colwellia sp. RSH04]
MDSLEKTTVTIIYYNENCIELQHEVKTYPKSDSGRVIIPHEFKEGKSIVAVCLGEIVILNKVGDRVISIEIDS